MSDKINAFFSLFQDRLLPHSASIAVIALVLALLSLFLFVKLKRARATIQELGERPGYDAPFGDGAGLQDQQSEKEQTERAKAKTVEELEQRIVDLEAAAGSKEAELASHQQRWRELEGQLAEARAENEKATARAGELAQAHQTAVEQLEQQMREKETESQANLAAVQERSKELEDQLQQASAWGNKVTTMANEQAQAHRTLVEQLEQRIRDMAAEHVADLTAHQRRAKDLEERLQLATFQHEQLAAQAGEQAQTHQVAVMQLEQRIRQMEVEGQAYLSTLEHHAKELEEQLQRALVHNEQLAEQASAQEQVHGAVVNQLEERIRQLEAGSGNVAALEQRAKELEEELRRACIRADGIAAQANEQAQAYRTTIENLEQRIRDMEAEGIASSTAILQRSKELEEQLRQAHLRMESDRAAAQQEALADKERLEQRIRDLEAEKDGGASRVQSLEAQVRELAEQLQAASAPAETGTAAEFLRRAEWITACAVGAVLPHGLVAAEAYAAAALADDPQNSGAAQLAAELARIHRAYREGLPPVAESITTFEAMAAAFFATDSARAAEVVEDEAKRRTRAGLNRSALLAANLALELRQKTDLPDSPAMLELRELKATLVKRLGGDAAALDAAVKIPGLA